MSLFSSIIYWNIISFVILSVIVYVKWDIVQLRLLMFLKAKIGLDGFEKLQVTLDARKRLTIYLSGVKLHRVKHHQTTTDSPVKLWINRLVSSNAFKTIMEFILNVPVHLMMATLANYVTFHVDHLSFEMDRMTLQVEHIKIESELTNKNRLFQEKIFTIQVQIGPTTFKLAEKPVVDMTTICLVSISCHFRARRLLLRDLDLDVQFGKTIFDINTCMALIQGLKQTSHPSGNKGSSVHIVKLEDILNTINIRIQSVHFNYVINKEIVTNFDICNIALFFSSTDGQPSCQFNTETISYFLAHHRLLLVPKMEINISLPDQDPSTSTDNVLDILPITDLVSVIWIIDTPVLQLPFQSKIVQGTLRHLHASLPVKSTATTNQEISSPKLISDLPMCHLAIVLKSPKFILAEITGLHGYMSSQSLIIRLSGEYTLKSRNNNYDDVPSSSSSSSASHLDSMFAREEYKWLSYSPEQQKRHSIHEFSDTTKRRVTVNRLRHLMGRVSRQKLDPTQKRPSIHKKWNYKLSMKVIIQRASLGYEKEDDDDMSEEFIRIKHAVMIVKSNMNVIQHEKVEILFALGNTIHSEAAIDRPMICLCQQDTVMSASVFWLKSVPQALQNQYLCIFATNVKKDQKVSPNMQTLMKNLSCSLDVTEGSIVAWSVDTKQHENVQVPHGFIDNTPAENIHTRIILDTQKFTFVYQGTELILEQSQWSTRCHLEKLYIHQASTSVQNKSEVKELLEKDEKQHLILWISQFNFGTNYSQQHNHKNLLHITTKAKKIGISYSIRNHYALLLFARSMLLLKDKLKGEKITEPQVAAKPNTTRVIVDASIGRTDIQVGLPFEKKLHLRLDDFKYQKDTTEPHTRFRNIMLLGTSPSHKNKWEQLVELDQVQMLAEIDPIFADSQIDLKAKKIFATVPYKFVLADVIDSIIGLVKAIKELHARILNNQKVFTYFGPSIKNEPIVIPNIKLRTKLFSIHFDDDPFEAKLRNILRTGLAEQQRRTAYENALDEKVNDMLYAESSSFKQQYLTMESLETHSNTGDTSPDSVNANTISTDNTEIQPQIAEAQKSLLEYFSEFWIRHINKTKKEEKKFYSDLYTREHYRNSETAANIDRTLDDGDSRRHGRFLYSKTFIIDIIPRPTHPPLVGFVAQFARVSFKRANFSINETRNFIYHTGGGVPVDNDFSIIIPFHLSIKAGKTWIKVRDYPLPLLYVPPPSDDEETRQSKTSWILEGDYVAADELGNSGGSRIIPIPIVPRKSEAAPGYCLSAVRTTSPLKFYSVIDYQVLAKDMSMICWSIPYSPAIQDILRVLDTLTAAQVDPSPKIGFWDKVRFIIHSRVKIDFIGGGDLALVVKGTRDPYQLKGRGAGLAKVWSNNVVWLLGHKNPQKEFMQIVSDDYAFGVPDLIRGGFVPDIPDSLGHRAEVMGRHRFSKVALKLADGIRMGIGLGFERLSCNDSDMVDGNLCFNCKNQNPHVIDRCRSQVFLPHYQVLFQSVEQVQNYHDLETYDAFRGFRSDFIHLSFSVVKLENNLSNKEAPDYSKDDPYFDLLGMSSHNSMHLSPCFIEHFLEWYRMFGSPLSLPIRQGKLFPTEELKAKPFGELLNTIKYKIVIDPLAIGMFFTDLETYLNIKGGGSVGLKARVSSFSVDLHQRREVAYLAAHDSLKNNTVKTAINLHEAEAQLTDIDLRVVKAVHYKNTNQSDQRGSKTYPKSVSESTSIPISEYATSSLSAEDENSSFQWIDSKDFVILDSVTRQLPHYSKTEVFPFAYSPLFHYVKQTDELDTEKRQYLRQTHDCIFGKGIESQEFQRTYMDRRANELSKVIDDHDKQLDIILHAIETYKNSPKELQAEYDILLKKIDYLQKRRYMLHAYLAELILDKEMNRDNGERDSPRTTTSSICRRDEISRWQMLMGHFKSRYFIHYPQIILNSSVREALYYLKDIRSSRSIQHFNLSARCLKFLEELVQTAEKQKQWKPDAPEPSGVNSKRNSTCFNDVLDAFNDEDKDTTEALIEKLLSERLTNFVAYNEKEEHKRKKKFEPSSPTSQIHEGIHVFENSKNFDDPDYQYQSIPDFYKMTSDYLIDLIHPQVVFQSNKGLDHLVLLTNERLHVKGFNIMDNTHGVCTADTDINLVKKRVVASFDNAQLLIAKKIEEIESYSSLAQNCYGQFQEKHWAVWTQPELLWSCQNANFFENFQRLSSQLTGSMQFDLFNHLRIKINKYNNSRESPFEDRTNTTQLHLPQLKITLSSLQAHILYYTLTDLVLGSEESPKTKLKLSKSKDVMLAAERSDLAETVEQVRVLQNRSRNLLNFYRQFKGEFAHLDLANKKVFLKNKRRMRESLKNLYLIVEAIRSIQMFRRDIHLEETDDANRFIFTSDELIWEAMLDYANNKSLCKCVLNNTNYVLLKKPNGSSRNTIEIDRMQIKNTTESPVFDNVLDAYMDPSNPVLPDFSRYKMISGMLDTLPPVGGIPIIQHLEVNLLPLNLQLSTLFFELALDYFFPQIVHNKENEHDVEEHYVEEEEHNLIEEYDEECSINENNNQSDKTNLQSPPKREGSFISLESIAQKVKQSMARKAKVKADELTVMKTRSSTNRTFIFVRIPSAKHCISIQGPSRNTIYNIYNFMFKQPSLEYRNVTWTMAEMTEKIKREFKRALFRQSPALLKKKLLANNKQNITNVTASPQEIITNREIVRYPIQEADEPSKTSEIDLMDDSIVYNKHDISEPSTSYNTEDEDIYSNHYEETKSLYSNDPADDQERLIELQVASRNEIINVDDRLSSVYLKTYKREDDNNELIEKGRILFGVRYNGPTH